VKGKLVINISEKGGRKKPAKETVIKTDFGIEGNAHVKLLTQETQETQETV
jgi:hypothetical protein